VVNLKRGDTEAALKREIEQIGADRRKLNQDLIDTAGRIRGLNTARAGACSTRTSNASPASTAMSVGPRSPASVSAAFTVPTARTDGTGRRSGPAVASSTTSSSRADGPGPTRVFAQLVDDASGVPSNGGQEDIP